jgi:hypothetical protein
MLTYRVRKRVFRVKGEQRPEFPAHFDVTFEMAPGQPFGTEAGGGKTAVRAVAAMVQFNANTGHHYIESSDPLKPLDVSIAEPERTITLRGSTLTVSATFATEVELAELVSSIYYGLPILLNVEFADPPIVQSVTAQTGDTLLRWELTDWKMPFTTTTQDEQEEAFVRSYDRFSLISAVHRRRLVAALHYFHVACRLNRVGAVPGEFLAEVILNLAKVLEALYPPPGDAETIDAARRGLSELGFRDTEIERDFVPAIALRNQIDVGHVHLSVFSREQLRLLHAYATRAEDTFRKLMVRVLTRIADGSFDVPEYTDLSPDRDAIRVIERLAEHTKPDE